MHLQKNTKVLIAVGCILVLILSLAVGTVFSKYRESIALSSVSFTVSSGHLADAFSIQEHKAVQTSVGTYTLDQTKTVQSNSYRVLPGVTLPKDPYITIQGKSKVPTYLYVEIVNGLGTTGLSYDVIASNWQDLNLTGPLGGKVYVYTGGSGKPLLLDETFSAAKVEILANNQITVDKANKDGLNVSLRLHGYLAQGSLAPTAKEVFEKCF